MKARNVGFGLSPFLSFEKAPFLIACDVIAGKAKIRGGIRRGRVWLGMFYFFRAG
jgi:hypothetical protein